MSIIQTIKKPVLVATAVALVATGSVASSVTQAEAGKKERRAAGAFIGGLIIGGAIAAGSRHRHGGSYHSHGHSHAGHSHYEDCWTEKHVYWRHGHRRVKYVEVCD